MNRVPAIALAVAMGAAFTTANAQFSARSVTPKVPSIGTPATGGGFQQGADDCAAAHTNAGSGDVSGVPFDTTTGTTGTTGQSDPLCYAFGSSGIDNDVWFDWTCNSTGNGRVTTCNGTSADTKIGVYASAGGATCPGGAALSCNDDACGLQSTATWAVTAGSVYTIQLGSFPGASGGTGTFDVIQTAPPACGQYDDGSTENALGLTAGGEMGWIQTFTCLGAIGDVQTAYGTLMFPGSVTNGNNSRIAIYDDSDNDPTTGGTLTASATVLVVNGDTDIINSTGLTGNAGTGNTAIMATADQVAGEFPGPMDQDNPAPEAWVVGSTLGPGSLDINNLNNNNVPPMNMTGIGFPASWLLRADSQGPGGPGVAECFGDGNSAPCGCNNEVAGTEGGCRNGINTTARLDASGTASTSGDTLGLTASDVTAQPGLMFQGDNSIGGGTGVTFGDGIRCCGMNVIRLEVLFGMQPEPTSVTTTITVSTHPAQNTGGMPGTTFCYQYWYRNPGSSPCGANFNFSNAQSVLWS